MSTITMAYTVALQSLDKFYRTLFLHIALILKRLLPALLFFCIFAFSISHYIDFLSRWHSLFLPSVYLAGLTGLLVAWRFGRSRMVLLNLFMLSFVYLDSHPVINEYMPTREHQLLALMLLAVLLIWQKDKGLQPRNALFTLLFSAVSLTLALWLLPLGLPWLSQLLATSPSWLLAYTDNTPLALPIVQISLISLAFIRILLVPDNTHIGLFICLLSVAVIDKFPAPYIAQLVYVLVMFILVLAIFIDSFNMAFRDELTTIPSRRALMQYVQTLGRKYTVVMGDIDHFKSFNDTYGHDVGDQVIKLVASQLNDVTGGGKAFRYGGEEFTIVFANKTPSQVKAHVEVLRELIANYPITLRGDDRPEQKPKKKTKKGKNAKAQSKDSVTVTCSFGIAERTSESKDFFSVLKQADVALYAAKQAGRNCVKVAG